MSTFKEMSRDGTIKRADAMKIGHADIHVEPGFNLRDTTSDEFHEGIASLKAHIKRGGQVPALEVRPRDEGGVWLVDGHRRHIAFGQLIAEGDPITQIAIVPFVGNDADRVARIMTSNEGAKLKPLEVAEGYRRLAAFGLTPDDIARRVCKTRQHVDQLLILANADTAVQRMVADGEVSATTAVDVARKHGNRAAGVLKDAKAAAGDRKVTAAAVKPWTPPAKITGPLVATAELMAKAVPNETREQLLKLEGSGRLESESVVVTLPAYALFALLDHQFDIEEARKAALEKIAAKNSKAAQMLLAGTDGA